MIRKFYSKDGKREYLTNLSSCTCKGYSYKKKCWHINFLNYLKNTKQKKIDIADHDFVKKFILLKLKND